MFRALRSRWKGAPAPPRALLLIALILYPSFSAASGRFPGADGLEKWKKQVEANPADPGAHDNLGRAQYRAGDYAAAADSFGKALGFLSDPALKSKSAYNQGNAFFRQGNFEKAVEKYKEALRLSPKDMDAKYNLELAQRFLKAGESSSSSKSSEGKGGEKEKKDGGAEEKNQEKGGSSGGEQEKDGRGEKDGADGETPEDKKPGPGAAMSPEKMSEEDVDRILQSLQGQERDARRKIKMPKPEPRMINEDW